MKILFLILLTFSINAKNGSTFSDIEENTKIDSSHESKQKLNNWLKFSFGYKLPGTEEYGLKIDGGLWVGAGLNFGLSEYFSIQPELNLWKGREVAPIFKISLTTIELLTFLSYDKLLVKYSIRPYAGLGFGTVNRGVTKENLLSLNLGAGCRIMLMKSFLELNLRYQSAGSNNTGGGSGYQSWFLGMSYGFPI